MKFDNYLVCILSLFIMISCKGNEGSSNSPDHLLPEWAKKVGARTSPDKKDVFYVNDYGATGDGKTLTTKAIQKAIDACAENGGGIVTFREGAYLTGSIFLSSNIELNIPENVTLFGSQILEDYREIDTRVAGIEMKWPAALINVIDGKNVAITGKGTVHAQGKPFWDAYWDLRKIYEEKGLRWIVDYDAKRPRTLLVQNSVDVSLNDITLKQAGFWTVHILYSKYITVDGLVIRNNIDGHGPSTDGVDIDSSSWILVQNCDIDCNDDNFCLKAGRDADGLRVNRPTEYVVIRDCISRKGGGLITFGSETSGSIRHVLAYNLKAKGTGIGLRFKSALTRGGIVEDVVLRDIVMDSVGTAIQASMNWNPSYSYSSLPEGYNYEDIPAHWKVMLQKVDSAKGLPEFRNVKIENVKVNFAERAISVYGVESSPIHDFVFENIEINAKQAGKIVHANNLSFNKVLIKTDNNNGLIFENAQNIDTVGIEYQ